MLSRLFINILLKKFRLSPFLAILFYLLILPAIYFSFLDIDVISISVFLVIISSVLIICYVFTPDKERFFKRYVIPLEDRKSRHIKSYLDGKSFYEIPAKLVREKINLPKDQIERPVDIIRKHRSDIIFFPFSGGWGYEIDDPIVIDKIDTGPTKKRLNISKIEQEFVKARLAEELHYSRPEGERLSNIKWQLLSQELIQNENNSFDCLKYEISGDLDPDIDYLRKQYKGKSIQDTQNKKILDEHKNNRKVTFKTEYWFDISNHFGRP